MLAGVVILHIPGEACDVDSSIGSFWLCVGAGLVWLRVAAEPVELFNGKDLTGWKPRGGAAKYSAEDGTIVGRSVPNTTNTFLTTEKEYGDFELQLDFKIDDPTFNSGVQIRSHARPKGDGEVVYGYQIEIDPVPIGLGRQVCITKRAATNDPPAGFRI